MGVSEVNAARYGLNYRYQANVIQEMVKKWNQ